MTGAPTKKIMLAFGTRPEAIKMCPLALELAGRRGVDLCICLTGQHREQADEPMRAFGVTADYDLSIMRDGQTLFDITRGVLDGIRPILSAERPDILLVHGDTTSAFSAALAAFYLGIPVGHVEAGLRTHRTDSPYPEEFNRRAVGMISSLDFAPTDEARGALISEGKDPSRVFTVGSTAIDALRLTYRPDFRHPLLDWASGSRLVLMTLHRRESSGDIMRGIFRAIRRAVREHPDVKLICPVHPGAETRAISSAELGGDDRILLTPPLGTVDFHNIERHAHLILTDSGGIEEEAPTLGVPVIVLRDVTERPEGVRAGIMRLAGTDGDSIYREFCAMLDDPDLYRRSARSLNAYGDGHASRLISDILISGGVSSDS